MHPAEPETTSAQKKLAKELLKRWSVAVKKVYAVDLDRVAFVDVNGRARTALIEMGKNDQPKIKGVVHGWPV